MHRARRELSGEVYLTSHLFSVRRGLHGSLEALCERLRTREQVEFNGRAHDGHGGAGAL